VNIETEIEAIFNLLKEHLRSKRISYGELAKRLHMSESNVKRIFSTKSCSLQQAAQICDVAETSLIDLIEIAGKRIAPQFILPAETEEFFLQNFDAFIFFRNLFAAENPQTIINSSALQPDRIRQYLRKFEDFRLLKRKHGRIELVGAGYLNLSKCPALNKRLNEKWVPWFIGRVVHYSENPNYFLKASSTGLSKIHKAQLIEDIERVLQRYRDIGSQDQRIGSGDFESVGICIGIGPHRVGFFEDGNKPIPSRRY
jgi:DNA-binding Xre family transcriptional regulator